MKRIAYVALLLPLAAAASVNPDLLQSRAVLIRGNETPSASAVNSATESAHPRPLEIVGSIDTAGGTMYDIQFNGPAAQTIVNDPGSGIQATWMYSQGNPGTDRNMRWNFYDLTLTPPSWSFNQGADMMLWGLNWFAQRSGFGNLDVAAASHCAYISAHYTGPSALAPTVARDVTPGGGSPEECPGAPVADAFVWPAIGVSGSGTVHAAIMDDASGTQLYYSRISPWCTWSAPISIRGVAPDAGFPNYNIAVSRRSNTVAVIWASMNANPVTEPLHGFYRISRNDGVTWEDPVEFGPPPVFTPGSDSQPSFDITSLYGLFDAQDSLHIVGQVIPFFTGAGLNVLPAVVCHYSAATGWTTIHRSQSDTLAASVGSNASYAGRPSIAEGRPGEFVCIWEQFDSLNLEPNTSLLRADILAARSVDGGVTWGPAVRIATGGTSSLRFPCVAARITSDTLHALYLQDLEAGDAATSGQGTMTNNPIIHQKVWTGLLRVDVAEGRRIGMSRAGLDEANPSVFRSITGIEYEVPAAALVRLSISDVSGRPVRTLVNRRVNAGRHRASWDGRKPDASPAVPGIYFCTLTTGGSKTTKKLTLLH